MTKIARVFGVFLLTFLLTACGEGRADKVETPSGMNMQRGRNYKEVIEDFQDKGFTNIRVEPIEDLVFGWVVKNGEVEEISVGGDKNYDPGVWVPKDTEVVIRYHTFNTSAPEEEKAEDASEAGGKDSAKAAEKAVEEAAGRQTEKAADEQTEKAADKQAEEGANKAQKQDASAEAAVKAEKKQSEAAEGDSTQTADPRE